MIAHDWDSSMGLFPSEMRSARENNNPDNYLFIIRNVIPYMREIGVKDNDINTITIDNPRRYLEYA